MDNIKSQLAEFPSDLSKEFCKGLDLINLIFKPEELTHWAEIGLAISQRTSRGWEAALEYFKVSGDTAKYLPFSSFVKWAMGGDYLSQASPSIAASYFRASSSATTVLSPMQIAKWAAIGSRFYKGTWKSSSLASSFFDSSPELISGLSFAEVEEFSEIIEILSGKSYEIAKECLSIGASTLVPMGMERAEFLSLCRAQVENGWRDIRPCFNAARESLHLVSKTEQGRFLNLITRLSLNHPRATSSFLQSGATTLGILEPANQQRILGLAEDLLPINSDAVFALFNNLEVVLKRLTITQLGSWFEKGIAVLNENQDAGLAYFKIESNASERMLASLSSSVELERIQHILLLYCKALSGMDISIVDSKEIAGKGIGWIDESNATTEGTNVYLPTTVDRYHSKDENFGWYKVVSTHQSAHIEFGSFLFSFLKPSSLFLDSRLRREVKVISKLPKQPKATTKNGQAWITDMGRFFALFEDRKLALDTFTIMEDGRLDFKIASEYPGIKEMYRQVQSYSLAGRSPISEMPLRQALMEFLVRISLGQRRNFSIPKHYKRVVQILAKIQRRLNKSNATVEDASEATCRAYDILIRIPNMPLPENEWENTNLDMSSEYSEDELQELLEELGAPDSPSEDDSSMPYEAPEEVDFRGGFKPELVQTLNMMRLQAEQSSDGSGDQVTKELLEEMLSQSPEVDLGNTEEDAKATSVMAQNLLAAAGPTDSSKSPGQGHGQMNHVNETGGPLQAHETRSFVYDEWDFRAGDYKPKWCIVKEKQIETGSLDFFNETMQKYSSLLTDVRRQFELVIPQSFHKVRKQTDGDEIDLDAAMEALIDLRSGITPSEKVYWFRNKRERDVAVVFLLDMSASTAEAIDDGSLSGSNSGPPDDPVEYMMWLRSRREGLIKRNYKRIIDLEKEGVALLIQALESIGDTYGIYGFSGYGRENVEYYIIKDIDEGLSDSVKKRIDKVSPLHATRMGPAIRHATSKLHRQTAKTKILFLISDGRPQDRGYSREGVEKEYAVHDTHMALLEAKRKDIMPFCLTVDKSGHDYLKAMCGDMRYEILADIWTLPQRLPLLYRQLSV